MKRLNYFFICVLLGTLVACGEDDNDVTPGNKVEVLPSAINLDEFETDEGEIGISLNMRSLARKGYKPTTATIRLEAAGTEEYTIPVDQYNNLANLAFENSDLPDELENTLKEGVAAEVTILDENGTPLATKNFSRISFRSSPPEQMVDETTLPDLRTAVSLRENVLHYIQIINSQNEVSSVPASDRYTNPTAIDTEVRVVPVESVTYPSDYAETFTSYYFKPVPGEHNTFNIYTQNKDSIHNWYIYPPTGELRVQSKGNIKWNGGNTDPIAQNLPNYYFRLVKERPGLYRIISLLNDHPLYQNGSSLFANKETDSPAYFRILALDIDWDIQTLSAEFMAPIMPPTSTSSAYNSTLRNCSSGSLSQTIGETTTITTTQEAGWEETMSVASSDEGSVSLTLSAEAETSFFGNGGKTSASVTGSYTYTKTETQTSTRSGSLITSKSVQVSVSRDVGVPSGTAISVADVYQTYENVRMPFVQRFRIFGRYQKDNSSLKGTEILTQFAFNSFTGVVTDVQGDFIEVTVRGTTTIDRLIETTTESRDIPNACN